MDRIVIALGGNALLQKNDVPSFQTQLIRATEAFRNIAEIITEDQVVITHGNGPQVGNIALQNEYAKEYAYPMPLDVCGAMSQGLIGEALSLAYGRVKYDLGLSKEMSVVVTRTIVDENDVAFINPSKPVGPYYSKEEAERLTKEKGWVIKEDSGKGWRRLVASPDPIEIVEKPSILSLLNDGFLPVGVGGGGIPVFKKNGYFVGAEAVIDKDLASSQLASSIESKRLIILTDVSNAFINFGKKDQKAIGEITYSELEELYNLGMFGKGSMDPKIKGALRFLKKGGEVANITSLSNAKNALESKSGTVVYRN